jgi:hypothetical protein
MRGKAFGRMLLAAFFLLLVAVSAAHAAIDLTKVQKLLADDGAASDDFGSSVAVDGDTAIIGALDDDDKGESSGSAYVFVRAADGKWSQQAKLTADDGAAGDWFGWSVSVSGDTAVIGTPVLFSDNGGSAYVFVRAANGTWSQQAKLTAADGMAGDAFGLSVAVNGTTVVIGASEDDEKGDDSGSAYIFVRADDGTWTQQAKLTGADTTAYDGFGGSVAVDGDTAVIGADGDDNYSGAAYVFVRAADGITWNQQAKLTAADERTPWDTFGGSVAVDGEIAVIGAMLDSDKGNDSGAAYVFVRAADGSWNQQTKLTADDGAAEDFFGGSVAVSGDTVVVSAHYDDDKGDASGSAYMFVRAADGITWNQQAKLTADDGAAEDGFGIGVAVSGDTAVIGSWGDDDNGADSGSAYIFGGSDIGNTAPVANAGPNQSAVQDDTVCFDGSGSSDADNDPLTYLWSLTSIPDGSTAVLDNPTAVKTCFTADLAGTYQVSLTVNDGTVDSAPSTAEATATALSCHDTALAKLQEAMAVVSALPPAAFKTSTMQRGFVNQINTAIIRVKRGKYASALHLVQGGILVKTDGCAASGKPDKNDWLKDCTNQATVYALLQEALACLESMI